MNRRELDSLDRWITGNWGEDQFRDDVEDPEPPPVTEQPDLFPNVDADPAEVRRRELIAAAEERGDLVPTCRTCVENLYPAYPNGFGPRHRPRCEWGIRNGKTHCTCDTCF